MSYHEMGNPVYHPFFIAKGGTDVFAKYEHKGREFMRGRIEYESCRVR